MRGDRLYYFPTLCLSVSWSHGFQVALFSVNRLKMSYFCALRCQFLSIFSRDINSNGRRHLRESGHLPNELRISDLR